MVDKINDPKVAALYFLPKTLIDYSQTVFMSFYF